MSFIRAAAQTAWNLGLLWADQDPARAATLLQELVAYEQEIGHANAAHDAAVLPRCNWMTWPAFLISC